MQTSENLDLIAPAVVRALAEIGNATKDRQNPHFKSTYATLASLIDATKEGLASQGLVIVQSPGWVDGRATVTTRLIHKSGQWMESFAQSPIKNADAQGIGSAITYLRRYSLAAICGITQEDDDGNQASASKPRAKPVPEVLPGDWKSLENRLVAVSIARVAPESAVERALTAIMGKKADKFDGLRSWITEMEAQIEKKPAQEVQPKAQEGAV